MLILSAFHYIIMLYKHSFGKVKKRKTVVKNVTKKVKLSSLFPLVRIWKIHKVFLLFCQQDLLLPSSEDTVAAYLSVSSILNSMTISSVA